MYYDIWALWPDGFMCPKEDLSGMLMIKSDDYKLVNIIEYDGYWNPTTWEDYKPND